MRNYRTAGEFFAAEFGPDESKNDAHEENDDRGGGVCNSGSDGGRWSESERDAISSVSGDAKNEIKREWTKNAFVFLNDTAIVAKPFAIWVDDKEVHDTFADKE